MSHAPLFFFYLVHLAVIASRDQEVIAIITNTIFKTYFMDQKVGSEARKLMKFAREPKWRKIQSKV